MKEGQLRIPPGRMKYAKKGFQLFMVGMERKERFMLPEGKRARFAEEAAFEQTGCGERGQLRFWRNGIPGRGNSKCKGPEVGVRPTCLEKSPGSQWG